MRKIGLPRVVAAPAPARVGKTGLVYRPHANVTFSGAVNKSSNGASCFVLVVDNVTINGTADILPKGACVAAGLSMPSGAVGTVGLVR